jgi:hypothetical protein
MDWIDGTEYTDRWKTLLNVVMNIRAHKSGEFFLTSREPVSFSRRTLFVPIA